LELLRLWGTAYAESPATVTDAVTDAKDEKDIKIDVRASVIKKIKQAIKARFAIVAPFYEKGAVGEGADGYLALKDTEALSLTERRDVQDAPQGRERRSKEALPRDPRRGTPSRTLISIASPSSSRRNARSSRKPAGGSRRPTASGRRKARRKSPDARETWMPRRCYRACPPHRPLQPLTGSEWSGSGSTPCVGVKAARFGGAAAESVVQEEDHVGEIQRAVVVYVGGILAGHHLTGRGRVS
jgi:hypothetical protein